MGQENKRSLRTNGTYHRNFQGHKEGQEGKMIVVAMALCCDQTYGNIRTEDDHDDDDDDAATATTTVRPVNSVMARVRSN